MERDAEGGYREMSALLLILLSTIAIYSDPFAPLEPPPQTNASQSLALHSGWNLVSWDIVPYSPPMFMWQILPDETIPPPYQYAEWFHEHGKLWTNLHSGRFDYYPLMDGSDQWPWGLNSAYLMFMDASHTWLVENKPSLGTTQTIVIQPDPAWNGSEPVEDSLAAGWFFVGYSPHGYTKLSTIYTTWPPPDGSANYRSYRGPFHWLYWNNTETNKPHYNAAAGQQYLTIVKRDDGKVYIPYDPSYESPLFETGEPDEIGVLEPGRGYFLGFWRPTAVNAGMQDFSWSEYPGWPLTSLPSDPKQNQSQIASAGHFEYKSLTQFFYPIYVDTVEVVGDTIATGDEIAVFTPSGLCVGAVTYDGEFPLHLNAWQDDISTDSVDGYTYGEEMTFKLFDQSRNQELTFTLPPGIMAMEEDDPIAPTHSGFGKGLYALRNFTGNISSVQQLPQAFHLGQNYPNPFNSETIIPLELPQRSHVKIELFNVQGRSLGVIFEGVENAGWPKIHYDGLGLASGMYFCRVTAEGLERTGKYQSVGKLLLLK
jgi:hypothetical protein